MDEEQQLFLAANSEFGERVTIPNQVLFAVATFREPFDPHAHRYAVQGNSTTARQLTELGLATGDIAPVSTLLDEAHHLVDVAVFLATPAALLPG